MELTTTSTYTNGEVEMILRIPMDKYGHWSYLHEQWTHWLESFGFRREDET